MWVILILKAYFLREVFAFQASHKGVLFQRNFVQPYITFHYDSNGGKPQEVKRGNIKILRKWNNNIYGFGGQALSFKKFGGEFN